MTRRTLLALAALAAAPLSVSLVAQDRPAPPPVLRAEQVWVRLPAEGRRVTAGFLDVVNDGDTAVRIVGARSQAAGTIELHEMAHDNGMMRMRQITGIDVPARGRVTLAPGGLHLMLFDLATPLTTGTRVRIQLLLADGATLDVVGDVRAPVASR
jgi:copper(I)-binding protein